jgi:hypothetical protein
MSYYSTPNEFTRISKEKWMIEKLTDDPDFLFACVKSILVHPVDAGRQKVKYDRAKNGYFHAVTDTVDKILAYSGLHDALEKRELPLNTLPQDRAVLSCDHHALLFASLLRNIGTSVRVKTGYAGYIVPDMLIPHWIVEVLDPESGEWDLVDPERCIKKVNKVDFLFAHQAWSFFKTKDENTIPSYSSLRGRQGLKYALICELNCVFKNELLAYEWRLAGSGREKPEIVHKGYDRLSDAQKEDLGRIAGLLEKPDENIHELWVLYAKHKIEMKTAEPDIGD